MPKLKEGDEVVVNHRSPGYAGWRGTLVTVVDDAIGKLVTDSGRTVTLSLYKYDLVKRKTAQLSFF